MERYFTVLLPRYALSLVLLSLISLASLWICLSSSIFGSETQFDLSQPFQSLNDQSTVNITELKPSPNVDELILIDSQVSHVEKLLAGLGRQAAVVYLDPDAGIPAITRVLAKYQNLKAVHLLSHGSAGQLQLGQEHIDASHLARYSSQWQQWQQALQPGADILLYGCEVAAGTQGQEFIRHLSHWIQADVAASTDLTGTPALGGNWTLEATTGKIEADMAFSPNTTLAYDAVLKQIPVTITDDAGTGSLRWAIEQANATAEEDLIDLSQISGTISLKSSLPDIVSDMTIAGNGDDVISGNNAHRVLYVESGNVTLRELTIADGLAVGELGVNGAGGAAGMGGGLFLNGGTVTLTQVSFVNNHAIGGGGTQRTKDTHMRWATDVQTQIQTNKNDFDVNRGGIVGVKGISLPDLDGINLGENGIRINGSEDKYRANRGAIAGVNGIGIGGIGTIAFGGGGGFGGLGNGGNGGMAARAARMAVMAAMAATAVMAAPEFLAAWISGVSKAWGQGHLAGEQGLAVWAMQAMAARVGQPRLQWQKAVKGVTAAMAATAASEGAVVAVG